MRAKGILMGLTILEFLLIDIEIIFKIRMIYPLYFLIILVGWIAIHKSYWSRHGIEYEDLNVTDKLAAK